MLIEKILGHVDDFVTDGCTVETVALTHEEMQKPHQRVRTVQGRELAISLPHGEQMFDGAVLYADVVLLIYVELREEDLLEIRPAGNLEWGRTAFNIGNMHHPAYLHEDRILSPWDPVIERMLQNLGVAWSRKTGRLSGLRANVQAGGHSHLHSHNSGGHTPHSHTDTAGHHSRSCPDGYGLKKAEGGSDGE